MQPDWNIITGSDPAAAFAHMKDVVLSLKEKPAERRAFLADERVQKWVAANRERVLDDSTARAEAAAAKNGAIKAAAYQIIRVLERVEGAGEKGSGAGVYLADGKATLDAVVIPVGLLRALREAMELP